MHTRTMDTIIATGFFEVCFPDYCNRHLPFTRLILILRKNPITFLSLPHELRQKILVEVPYRFIPEKVHSSLELYDGRWPCSYHSLAAQIKSWTMELRDIHKEIIGDVDYVEKQRFDTLATVWDERRKSQGMPEARGVRFQVGIFGGHLADAAKKLGKHDFLGRLLNTKLVVTYRIRSRSYLEEYMFSRN
jgi:hypothetical protein